MKIEAAGSIPDYCRGCPYETSAVKAVAAYHPCGTTWKLELACSKQSACGHLWKRMEQLSRQKGE